MSLRLASPDADTMSYWPPPPCLMRVTISSDVPAYFAWILQPVCLWNGLTHWGCRYPSQATMVSLPSPFPIFVGNPEPLLAPDAGTHRATASAAAATCPL